MSQTLALLNEAHTHALAFWPNADPTPPPQPAGIANPLDGIVPDFTAFGTKFDALWKKLLGGAWAIALVVAIFYLIRGIVGIAQHKGGNHPSQVAESRSEAVRGGIAVGALSALGAIVGAILFITA